MTGEAPRPRCVLDASALIAFLRGEPGAEAVGAELGGALVSSVNWSEVVQKMLAHGVPVEGMRADLSVLGLSVVPFSADEAETAALLWPLTRTAGLSLGDRACLALTQRLGLEVLTADRSWVDLPVGVGVRLIR